MEAVLLELLRRLEAIGEENEELFDGYTRDALSAAALDGFIRADPEYRVPESFEMLTPEADELVRDAIASFLSAARQAAQQDGLDTFQKRLAAFQNPNVRTQTAYISGDFFSWRTPEEFDESGSPRSQ
jgi:hypothetical protein